MKSLCSLSVQSKCNYPYHLRNMVRAGPAESNPQASLPTRKTALDCRLCGACNVIQPPQVCCHAIALCWGFHLKSYAKSLNRLRQQRIQVMPCRIQHAEQMHFLQCCKCPSCVALQRLDTCCTECLQRIYGTKNVYPKNASLFSCLPA